MAGLRERIRVAEVRARAGNMLTGSALWKTMCWDGGQDIAERHHAGRRRTVDFESTCRSAEEVQEAEKRNSSPENLRHSIRSCCRWKGGG